MSKTLHMVFDLDNGKAARISLPNPREGLTGEDVRPVMTLMVTRHALSPKGAALTAIKSAIVREVKDTTLI